MRLFDPSKVHLRVVALPNAVGVCIMPTKSVPEHGLHLDQTSAAPRAETSERILAPSGQSDKMQLTLSLSRTRSCPFPGNLARALRSESTEPDNSVIRLSPSQTVYHQLQHQNLCWQRSARACETLRKLRETWRALVRKMWT